MKDRDGRSGVALVAVLLFGSLLLALAGMAGTMAALHGAAARHELEVQRARADAEAGVLWTQVLLSAGVEDGGPVPVPDLAGRTGGALQLVAFERAADGSVRFDVAARRASVRAVAGGRWRPP